MVSSFTILVVVLNLEFDDCHWGLAFAGTVMLMEGLLLLLTPKADDEGLTLEVVVVAPPEPEVKPEVNPLLLL